LAAAFGVRLVSYSGGGRRVRISSVAPERHRMPMRNSSPLACEVSVTSATRVRSNRLRSLSEVEGADHSVGRSAANASSSARGGSVGTLAREAACNQTVLGFARVERTLSPIGFEAGAFESQLAGARGS
jgi:hypothetical protein